jgi:hypothetical protein
MKRMQFVVEVVVEPHVIAWSQDRADDRTPLEVVSDEIESNLHSVPYVRFVHVQQGVCNDCEVPPQRQGQSARQAR